MGSSGLEPPTSRLSGARSNQLSYEPPDSVRFQTRILFSLAVELSPGTFVCLSLSSSSDWRWWDSNPWPPACRAGALPTELHPHLVCRGSVSFAFEWSILAHSKLNNKHFALPTLSVDLRVCLLQFSLERRWSSRTFRYGYLVTT